MPPSSFFAGSQWPPGGHQSFLVGFSSAFFRRVPPISPPQRHRTEREQTTWGRDARDTLCRPAHGDQVPGDEHPQPDPFSLPELGSQGMQPQSHACGLERTSPWHGEMGGEMGCGARRSLGCRGSLQRGHPILAPMRDQPCRGQDILPKALRYLGSLCLPPATREELQNLFFLVSSIKPCT